MSKIISRCIFELDIIVYIPGVILITFEVFVDEICSSKLCPWSESAHKAVVCSSDLNTVLIRYTQTVY